MTFREYLSELFFPPKCRCCKKPIRREQAPFCKECLARYQREKYALCPTCHKPHCRCVCRPKGATASVFYRSVFPYRTQSPGGRLILALKDRKDRAGIAFLAGELADCLRKTTVLPEDALVTFVPRSRKAILRTGTDQAMELAATLAKVCKLDFGATLRHTGVSGVQKELSTEERRLHAGAAYQIRKEISDLQGRTVVLVDDILTTGATFEACAGLLRQAGAGEIFCLSAGRREQIR